jgi:pimeloyl-ACP methyl ester carboxylesterase
MLHGAIGASDQLQPLASELKRFDTITHDFSGHGGKAYSDKPFSIAAFVDEVVAFLDERKIEAVDIFGYSMGGYVGMYLAKHHPSRIKKVITLATKFHWDEPTAAKECQMLDASKIEAKVPAFANALAARHAPNDWKEVLSKTADMLRMLGSDNALNVEDYASIATPSLILLGDRDKMVTLEETVAVFKSLPNGQMGILPDTNHPIEQVNLGALSYLIKQFLSK